MVPSDDFQAKIDALRAAQARHDEQIHALIRLAELQQGNLDKLDDTVADLAQTLVKERAERIERQKEMAEQQRETADRQRETAERQKEMAERQKSFDERFDLLISAIGEFIRRRDDPAQRN
ncbi:MAG TPA: hypothetical protein VGR73_12200 [Bryobacteraceae bacterium]|nr:hypothetical protein [Bryobacteraceae bacterium]